MCVLWDSYEAVELGVGGWGLGVYEEEEEEEEGEGYGWWWWWVWLKDWKESRGFVVVWLYKGLSQEVVGQLVVLLFSWVEDAGACEVVRELFSSRLLYSMREGLPTQYGIDKGYLQQRITSRHLSNAVTSSLSRLTRGNPRPSRPFSLFRLRSSFFSLASLPRPSKRSFSIFFRTSAFFRW